MAVTQRLEVRQTQSLVMTPQLQQAIKLLQMSNIELQEFIEGEIEQNPLLEREEESASAAPDLPPSPDRVEETRHSEPDDSTRDVSDLTGSQTLPSGEEGPLDTDYEGVYDNPAVDDWSPEARLGGSLVAGGSGGEGAGEGSFIERQVAARPTLRQHLLDQLTMDIADPPARLIGVHLIDMLDESGYLRGDLAALAETLGCSLALVEATLAKLQRFDPAGVFARDLRECLALQLADRDRLDPAMATLLDNLDLLARRQLDKLRQACGVDEEDIAEMIAEVKALNPKPALDFESEDTEAVVPDILMRPQRGGGWLIELNPDTLPRVLVNNSYYAKVSQRITSKADREYLSDQMQSANWLVRSVHQRANTILKVASEIVRKQDAFFQKGVESLRPLTLRDVAETVEMHESTISRVTANKYMETPRGLFELKYFFTSAVPGTGGDAHSAEAVRHRIKRLIEGETPDKTLSDDSLVELLRKDGIEIARRTVAKYRESMRIPSSVERRRVKSLV